MAAPTFKTKIYSDGADLNDMKAINQNAFVTGFTTNPSLLKKAGVTDYLSFAKEAVATFPDESISFEVFSNDYDTMKKEAELLHEIGPNVYVKVPIRTTGGEPTTDLIHDLTAAGVQVNITAIATAAQVKEAVDAIVPGTPSIVSIFVGRVADTGADPMPFVKKSVELTADRDDIELLWASTREIYNITQAEALGVDIVTVPPAILDKLVAKYGQTGDEVTMNTVKGFEADIKATGLKILD
ncbi:transaldolase [Secundilactobacillus folii]|uniref:Transaldolase n=1 Tax=Secundilactobacillus folii TaxID=2678357 RepID=A0A7X3C411_9LACO|nr:transaldolase [Secundilactobacillus folii]MTV83131.1 transaldolase [Secundilactobacillus folii]